MWQIYVLIFVLQAASATFTPTFQSVIPLVLDDEDDYTSALSLSRLAYDLEAVLAPMLAGVLLLVVSSSTLFFGTAAGFLGSAALVVSTALPKHVVEEPDNGAQTPFIERVRRGVVLFTRAAPLRAVMFLNLAVAAVGAFVLVQTVVIVRETFGLSSAWVPVALAANGLGSMTAAFALPRVLKAHSERRVMLTGVGLLIVGLVAVPLALRAGPTMGLAVVCVLWLIVGLVEC
jgi:predicted MFS family arabinose efflux permease